MTFKFPPYGPPPSPKIQRGDIGSAVVNAASNAIVSAGTVAANQATNKLLTKIENKLGIGLGRPSIDQILNNPVGALGNILGVSGGSTENGGWYEKLLSRPDPLMEIDWTPQMPLGLPAEYVEEIQWTHTRYNSSTGIFRQGSPIFVIEGRDTPPISLVLYEDRLLTAQTWLQSWEALAFNAETNTFNYPNVYKQHIRAFMQDVTGAIVGEVLFAYCFPTNYPQINMASEGSNRVRLTVECSCDRIVFAPISASGTGGSLEGGAGLMTNLSNQLKGSISSAVNGAFGSMATAGITKITGTSIANLTKGIIKF